MNIEKETAEMSGNMESNILRLRVRQLVDSYPEPSVLGDCDCTSYSYFFMSIMLLTLGTCITVSALGATEHYVFSNLGHMWLVGPLCICCGTMVGIKSFLYLRRKSVINMLIRQRVLLRGLQELAQQSRGNEPPPAVYMTASTLTLPPAYDLIVQGVLEPPPPTYAEAVRLIQQEKPDKSTASQDDGQDVEADKESV